MTETKTLYKFAGFFYKECKVVHYVIVRVHLPVPSRLRDLKASLRSESPWSLNGEDTEQRYFK